MPQLPIPPPMTLAQRLQTIQQISGNTSNPSIYQQAIMDAVEVKRIALEQAKQVLQEYMEQEQQKRKTILTIENIDKIVGSDYNDSLITLNNVITLNNKELDAYIEQLRRKLITAHTNSPIVDDILLQSMDNSKLDEMIDCQDTFYQFSFNRVYTVSALIDQYKSGGRGKFVGIKEIDNYFLTWLINYPI